MFDIKKLFKLPGFKIPILCYHAMNVSGCTYQKNDHLALEADIQMLLDNDFSIKPLSWVVREFLSGGLLHLKEKIAVLTFDDGPNIEYVNFETEQLGKVESFYNIIEKYQVPATSFIIASPVARAQIASGGPKLLANNVQVQYEEFWWNYVVEDDLLELANHSWDHNHDSVFPVAQKNQEKGNFYAIDNYNDAEAQVNRAHAYLKKSTGGNLIDIFGYPYGHVSDYLLNDYFPNNVNNHNIQAAVSTGGGYLNSKSNRWNIPRFVCGYHWKSSDDLKRILKLC